MKRHTIALALLFTSGCASYQPIIDSQGVDAAKHQADLSQCQQYAAQLNPAEHAVGGAVAGAVLGGVLGAIVGNRSVARQSAATWGVVGGASGAASGANAQRTIVLRCMAGRGYKVLY